MKVRRSIEANAYCQIGSGAEWVGDTDHLRQSSKKCFTWFSCLDFVRSIGSLLWWNISDRGGYARMAPVGERRTLKPVIIIPPQGTSSHPATHYNPFYFNAENDILYNSRTEYLSSPLYKILTHHKMIHIALRVKQLNQFSENWFQFKYFTSVFFLS